MNASELKGRMRLLAMRAAVRAAERLDSHDALARALARYVRPLDPGRGESDGAVTCLVLDHHRFRGDIELFAKASDVRFLLMSWELLWLLHGAFIWPEKEAPDPEAKWFENARMSYFRAGPGSPIVTKRERYRAFLRRFLPPFFRALGVDFVLNSELRFRRLADFCMVSSELGYPHVCLYREAMFIVPTIFQRGAERHGFLGPFWGDAVGVHNEITKEMFLASGRFDESQIHVIGCSRMDRLIAAIREKSAPPAAPQVTFFSSPPNLYQGEGTFDLSGAVRAAARAVARVAAANPNVRVIVKMKDLHVKRGYRPFYEDAIREAASEIPANVTFVTDRMAAHEAILAATVVVAMQSTVVLEAAVAGKPVIVPHFRFLREQPEAEKNVMFLQHHALFDVPETEADLEALIAARLRDPFVPEAILAARRALFERHVSPLDASATKRAIDFLRAWGERGRLRRARQEPATARAAGARSGATAADAGTAT